MTPPTKPCPHCGGTDLSEGSYTDYEGHGPGEMIEIIVSTLNCRECGAEFEISWGYGELVSL